MDTEAVRMLRAGSGATPIHSPILAGGLFSIDRELFFHLGGYDLKMGFWGAEHVELSLLVKYYT